MEAFLANITSFPTAIYTVLVILLTLYWLLSIVGVAELDILDMDIDFESSELSVLGSALKLFGFAGVPLTIVLTFISVFSFIFSYYAVHFGLLFTSAAWLTVLSGTVILAVSFVLALPVAGVAIRPFRNLFAIIDGQSSEKSLLGVTCSVRSSRVDRDFGEAECVVDGASLIIKVRSDDETFKRGDQVVIFEHDTELNFYHVVSSAKFNQ